PSSRRNSNSSGSKDGISVTRVMRMLYQTRLRCSRSGAVAEWLRSGLQSRVHQFDSGRRLSVRREPVAHSDRAGADDVGAQTSAVHERSQDAAAVQAVQVGAWLAQSGAAAARFAERELLADQRIEVGSPDDDVAAVVDVLVEGVEDGRVDQ